MNDNYVYSYVRRISALIAGLFFTLILILLVVVFNIPFREILNPAEMSYANNASSMYDSGVDYVQVTLYNAKYTGYDCKRNGKVYASYYYCLVNNQCTFVLLEQNDKKPLPETLDNYTIRARLIENNKLSKKMISDFSESLGWNTTGLSKISSKIIIDETSYHRQMYIFVMLFFGIIFIILFSFFASAIIHFIKPAWYPACRYYNMLEGTRSIAHVNYELESRVLLNTGNITLTENYIVARSNFHIEILPINNIIWAYEHSTWHHFFGLIFSLTYTLHFVSKPHMYTYSPRNTKEDIDTVIDYLKDNYPNIIIGYTKENKTAAANILKQK